MLLFLIIAIALQGGCSISDNAGGQTGGAGDEGLRLDLSVFGGQTTLVADGIDSATIQLVVTDGAGNPMEGEQVIFTTTAGTLSASSNIPAAGRATRAEAGTAILSQEDEESLTVETGANGVAEIVLTSEPIAATALVRAEISNRDPNRDNFSVTTTITFVFPPETLVVRAVPLAVAVRQTTMIEATAIDANGDPIGGLALTFDVSVNESGGLLASAAATTDQNGQASVAYTAGTVVGTDTIQVGTLDGISETVTVSVVPPAVASITLSASTTSVVANGTDMVQLQALALDDTGIGISEAEVTFTTTAGTLSSRTALTNADGVATVDLTAGANPVTAEVTATTPGLSSATLAIAFVAGPPDTVVVSANPTTVNPQRESTIQITVRDANNNPVANTTVTLSLPTDTSGASLSSLTAQTNESGQASVTYTAGITAGMDTIQADAVGGVSGAVTITVIPTPAASVTLTASATSVTANGASTVTLRATVLDDMDMGIPGSEVTFTATAGTLSSALVVTNTNGVATVELTAGTNLGTAGVTAATLGLSSETLQIVFAAGPPATVAVGANPSTVNPQGESAIQITVTDANNNPVANTTLTLSLPTDTSGALLSSLTTQTNESGQASVIYTAGSTEGDDVVQVETVNDLVETVTITVSTNVVPPSPTDVASVSVSAGDAGLGIVADGASRVTIRVTVIDDAGAPLPGVAVMFTTTAGTLPSGTASTNANGIAAVDLIAADNLGTATVTASAGGVTGTTTVGFVAGAPATVLVNTSPTGPINITAEVAIQATVLDATENPVANETLTFSITPSTSTAGGTLSALTGTTDTNGRFTTTYTAGESDGTDEIVVETTNNITPMSVTIIVLPTFVASSIDLLVSSPQLDSDGVGDVTLRALVRDTNNNVVDGALVSFAADSGTITVDNATTDASGAAVARLSTAGNPTNRLINVTATTASLTDAATVIVTGTTVSFSGTQAAVLNDVLTPFILVQDSSGTGIGNLPVEISSAQGNPLSTATVTTDTVGQATVELTAATAGLDILTAIIPGAEGSFSITISEDNFRFLEPAANTQIFLAATATVTLRWEQDGAPFTNAPVNFFTTRGVLSATSTTTNDAGEAQTTVSSTTAGPAIITATAPEGPATQVEVVFVATSADSLILQASPTTLGINQANSEDERSIITAVVRDAAGNIAQGQTVTFNLTDVTAGTLTTSTSITDNFGRASTVYVSSNTASAQDGVVIIAAVQGTLLGSEPGQCDPTAAVPDGPCDQVALTVAEQELFIALGTGNDIIDQSLTQYAFPYSVLVTDANGNPVEGTEVEINVLPRRYEKGFYTLFFDPFGNCLGWGKVRTVGIDGASDPEDADQACNTEDINSNGILDPGEDFNNNRVLDPEEVATVSSNVLTTDASGFALFDVVYAKEFTWVEVTLEARATVQGSEFSSTAIFFLPGLADDFNDCTVPPPGIVSAYGVATTCTCDERTTAETADCPTRNEVNAVRITALNDTTVPAETGGTVRLAVSGGTNTTYVLATTFGTLSASEVGSGEEFTLDVSPNVFLNVTTNFFTITVSATDAVTGRLGTLNVLQVFSPNITVGPESSILPAGGGTVTFTVGGGTAERYRVTTNAGILTNTVTGQEGSVIEIDFGQEFTLVTTSAQNGATTSLTVADLRTGQTGSAIVLQDEPGPIAITPITTIIPSGGGTATFEVNGGNLASYVVSTDGGEITNDVTSASGASIIISFGESFTLTTDAELDGQTITVTAIDQISGDQGTATANQGSPAPVRINLAAGIVPIPAGGGIDIVTFTVTGGTETDYNVATTFGTLMNVTTAQTGSIINVAFGENFTLTTNSSGNGVTITLTAVDALNGFEGSLDVLQSLPEASSIDLLVSSPQLDSDGSETVTLTALVRDPSSNAVTGVEVAFGANSGLIIADRPSTDASGTATALLGTGGDSRNRTIRVTAMAAGEDDENFVEVTGTTISFSGANSLVFGDSATLTIFLRDSGGNGIPDQPVTITSELGNTVTLPDNTDFNGQTTVEVTADSAAITGGVAVEDILEASALEGSATNTFVLTISPDSFVLSTEPAGQIEVNTNDALPILLRWAQGGVPQVNETVNFFATRGVLTPSSAVTDGVGEARTSISSSDAGPAVITATTTEPNGPTAQLIVQFVATTPAALNLQADPTIIGINAGGSTDQQSVITAVVRDMTGNLVSGQTVSFVLTDQSGGSINPPAAVTDQFGRASTIYTAGLSTTGADGVIIDAAVGGLTARVTLTVAGQALFLRLGTSEFVAEPNTTQYAKPYTVLVTDAEGNPVPNQEVTLSVVPTRYRKGIYVFFFGPLWEQVLSIDANSGLPDDSDLACNNEDANRNGILDLGEDINNNLILDPGIVATVFPARVTTDATGAGFFDVIYPQDSTWVEVELEARTTVQGTESFSNVRFFLPRLLTDFNNEAVFPPGLCSPFGIGTTCGSDSRFEPTCP